MIESKVLLSRTIDKEDLQGLLEVMQILVKIDERNVNVQKMFDSIKETIKLLKEYDIEFDDTDKVTDQLVMLPEDWNKLIKMALTVTQAIAPIIAYQTELNKKRVDLFNLRTKNYRKRFKEMPVHIKKQKLFSFRKLPNN